MSTTVDPVPQTVDFELRLKYLQMERPSELPMVEFRVFEVFEDMLQYAYKARRRRKLIDRATVAEYHVRLTDHGKEVCAADERRRASHEPMLGIYHRIY